MRSRDPESLVVLGKPSTTYQSALFRTVGQEICSLNLTAFFIFCLKQPITNRYLRHGLPTGNDAFTAEIVEFLGANVRFSCQDSFARKQSQAAMSGISWLGNGR